MRKRTRAVFASLLFASMAGCSGDTAFADRVAAPQPLGPRVALEVAPAKLRAPYDVQVIRDNGDTLPTFAFHDRFYVEGNTGERYLIRVTNPTPNRVEAVVSVDGIDVIDGETADTQKRGYIVPPYGETRVEGFRTSLDDVATFRFSSVDGSYAGEQGKARNVGVIAVAIFEETAPQEQQVIVGDRGGKPATDSVQKNKRGDFRDVPEPTVSSTESTGYGSAATLASPPPAATAAPTGGMHAASKAAAPAKGRRVAEADGAGKDDEGWMQPQVRGGETVDQTHRLGLGTEFGEQRYSSATYTRFVRAANRPVAVAELRYNDAAGLIALGIPAQPLPDEGELMTRETADPFPNDSHFSRAP
jgi:hypothetical protein